MAGDWIKWTKGLPDKREVMLIASRLKRDRFETAARLMTLWEWVDSNIPEEDIDSETGDASIEMGDDWSPQIDEITRAPGIADALASPAVCWLSVRSGGRVTFRNIGRHNGETAKSRALGRDRKIRSRSKRDGCHANTVTKSGQKRDQRREEKSKSNPPNPQGGIPSGARNWSEKRKRSTRVGTNSELMARIGSWFGRKPETRWTVAEALTIEDIAPGDDELELMEGYYTAHIPAEDYRRRDLITLLNNWNGELDRARIWRAEQ